MPDPEIPAPPVRAITSAQYETSSHTVVRVVYQDGGISSVPVDPSNGDYLALQAWDAEEGNDIAAEPGLTWDDIRADRDGRLLACDWTHIGDSPLSTEAKATWATYRQTLRDIPATYAATGPDSVVWPTEPV